MTLGEYLRSEREKRGITIEQVASETKIGVRILHALESDSYADLPAAPFVRGFVNSYSRFIGLDSKEVLTRYHDFIDERSKSRPKKDAGHSGYAFERREGEESHTMLWMLLGGFLFFGIIAIVVLKPSLKHKHHSHAEKLKEVHSSASPSPSVSPLASASPAAVALEGSSESPSPAVTPSGTPSASPALSPSPAASASASPSPSPAEATHAPSPSPTPEKSASPTPSAAPSATVSGLPKDPGEDPRNSGANIPISQVKHKAIVKADDRLYVRYRVDDRPTSQLVLGKDRRLVLRARKSIWVQMSEPERATLDLNGQGFKPVGQIPGASTHDEKLTLHIADKGLDSTIFSFDDAASLPKLPATQIATPKPLVPAAP